MKQDFSVHKEFEGNRQGTGMRTLCERRNLQKNLIELKYLQFILDSGQ